MKIGKNIRLLRKSANVTLRSFAEKIAISASFLSDVEREKSNPSIDMAERIADGLGVPLWKFFLKEGENPTQSSVGRIREGEK